MQLVNSGDNIEPLQPEEHMQKTEMIRAINQNGISTMAGYKQAKKSINVCQKLEQMAGDHIGAREFFGHIKQRYMKKAAEYEKSVILKV